MSYYDIFSHVVMFLYAKLMPISNAKSNPIRNAYSYRQGRTRIYAKQRTCCRHNCQMISQYGPIDSVAVTRGHYWCAIIVVLALVGTVITVCSIMHTAMHNILEIALAMLLLVYYRLTVYYSWVVVTVSHPDKYLILIITN